MSNDLRHNKIEVCDKHYLVISKSCVLLGEKFGNRLSVNMCCRKINLPHYSIYPCVGKNGQGSSGLVKSEWLIKSSLVDI